MKKSEHLFSLISSWIKEFFFPTIESNFSPLVIFEKIFFLITLYRRGIKKRGSGQLVNSILISFFIFV